MVTRLLFVLVMAGFLAGCQQNKQETIIDKIQFVPNKSYIGDANPIVKEQMKLTEQERVEFEKIQHEIMSEKEGK